MKVTILILMLILFVSCSAKRPVHTVAPIVETKEEIKQAEIKKQDDSINMTEGNVSDESQEITLKTETGEIISFDTVHFDFDSSTLKSEDTEKLTKYADYLIKDSKIHLVITGHCDKRGTDEYNLALGAKRAESIKDFLVNLGVASDRLKTGSMGEENPVAAGEDEDIFAQNRRGEFKATNN
jgi:peptidoglycan-associated lipoprotein